LNFDCGTAGAVVLSGAVGGKGGKGTIEVLGELAFTTVYGAFGTIDESVYCGGEDGGGGERGEGATKQNDPSNL
jgi:hypothetical protein